MDPIEARTRDIKRRIQEYKKRYAYLYTDEKPELLTKSNVDSNIKDSNSLDALKAKLRGKV